MITKAAIYARVSTDEQAAKGYSLPTQLEACRKYAKEKGMVVVGEFSDDVSGAELNRPKLDEMRELIQRDSIRAVVVYDLDRLSRKAIHQLLLEEEFAKRGAQVHYVLGQYDNTPEGRLQKQLKGAIAEYEREKIRERSVRGKRGKAKAGFYIANGAPPYGYRRVEQDSRVVLVIEKREGKIVRLIFHWYVYGDESGYPLSFYKIAEKLTAMGIPSPGMMRGHYQKKSAPEHWRGSAVQYIVRSETYAGVWHFSRYQWSGKKSIVRPRSEWIPVKVPAIIDNELWNAAQKRASENHHRTHPSTKRQYLMQARLQCAHCGSAYTGSTSVFRGGKDVYSYYKCNGQSKENSRHWHDKKCTARQVRADVVDARAWEWLQTIFEQPEKVLADLRVKQAEQQHTHRLLADRIEIIDTELAGCRKKLANMIDLCTNTAVSDETKAVFEEKEAEINRQIAKLQDERATLAATFEQVVITDKTIQTIEKVAADVKLAFPNATFEEKRALIEMLDVRGMIQQVDKRKSLLEITCVLDDKATRMIEGFYQNRGKKGKMNLQQSSEGSSPFQPLA